jgi:hypothetical protein
VAGVDVGAERRHDRDQAPAQHRQVGRAPERVQRLAVAQDRVQAGGDLRRGSLGVAVVGQRARDDEAQHEDPARDQTGGEHRRRHARHADRPEHGPDRDECRYDGDRFHGDPVDAESAGQCRFGGW